jgi:hypothetical protein
MFAKQSTAKSFLIGPILDADGEFRPDEVVGSIKVTKNGTVGSPNASSTLTHSHTGHYIYAAAAGDLDTLGEVEFSLNSGTNAMGPVKFQVVPANVYDSLVAGSEYLSCSVQAIEGADATTTLEDTIDARLTANANSGVITKPGDAMTLTSAYDAAKTAASPTQVNAECDQAIADAALATAANLATVDTVVDAIKAKTDAIGALAVTFQSPVAADDSVTIYAGADYSGGAALTWTITGYSGPSLAVNTAKLRLQTRTAWASASSAASAEFTATVTQVSTTLTIAVALTDAQTGTLAAYPPNAPPTGQGNYHYQIVATAGENTVVLVDGWATVLKSIAAPATE